MHDEVVVYVNSDLQELIPGYLEYQQKELEMIRNLLIEGNLVEIQKHGHTMRGSGAGYGCDEITNIGMEIEEAAKNGNKKAIEWWCDNLDQYLSVITVKYFDG